MGQLRQRVAYVSGLAAGLEVAGQTAEGRVLAGILEVLDAMAEEMERLDRRLGELGVLAPGAAADLVAWRLDGLTFAGALTDPVEALLRCGPTRAHHTIVAGRPVVEDGELRATGVGDILARHRLAAARLQGVNL